MFHRFERGAQGLEVTRTIGGGANGVQLEPPSANPQLVEKGGQHLEQLGVAQRAFGAGPCGSKHLGADLPELPITTSLRPLAAKLRSDVVKLLQDAELVELVFDVGADDASGVFRPQGEALAAILRGAMSVGNGWPAADIIGRDEGVHLFRDDVGFFADAAGEELRVLEDGRADLAEAIACKDRARGRFDAVPQLCLRREQVPGPTHLEDHGHA